MTKSSSSSRPHRHNRTTPTSKGPLASSIVTSSASPESQDISASAPATLTTTSSPSSVEFTLDDRLARRVATAAVNSSKYVVGNSAAKRRSSSVGSTSSSVGYIPQRPSSVISDCGADHIVSIAPRHSPRLLPSSHSPLPASELACLSKHSSNKATLLSAKRRRIRKIRTQSSRDVDSPNLKPSGSAAASTLIKKISDESNSNIHNADHPNISNVVSVSSTFSSTSSLASDNASVCVPDIDNNVNHELLSEDNNNSCRIGAHTLRARCNGKAVTEASLKRRHSIAMSNDARPHKAFAALTAPSLTTLSSNGPNSSSSPSLSSWLASQQLQHHPQLQQLNTMMPTTDGLHQDHHELPHWCIQGPAAPESDIIAENLATLEIHRLRLRDVAPVFHLGERLFSIRTLPNLYRTFDEAAVTEAVTTGGELCSVAEVTEIEDGQPKAVIIGFLLGSICTKDETSFAYVDWLGVRKEYHRRGVGTKLYQRFVETVRKMNVSIICGDTQANNTAAVSFFRKMGLTSTSDHVYFTLNIESHRHHSPSTSSTCNSSIDSHYHHHHSRERDRDRDRDSYNISNPDEMFSSDGEVNWRFTSCSNISNSNSNSNHNHSHSNNDKLAIANGEIKTEKLKKYNFRLRLMELDDLTSVYKLGELVFTETHPNLFRYWHESEVLACYQSDGDYCLVVVHEKEVVGFAMGTMIEKAHSSYGYLIWIAIAPHLQGHGIAQKLFQCFKELMARERVRILIIDTEASNYRAIKFFKNLGFGHAQPHVYFSSTINSTSK